MKKILSILAVSLMLSVTVYSQKQMKFGISVSPQISWLNSRSDLFTGDGAVMGFNFGLQADRYFDTNYAFSTGLLLNTLGARVTLDDQFIVNSADTLGVGSSLKYKTKYLTVPLGLKLKTDQFGYTTFFANVGFNNSFRLSATGDYMGKEDESFVKEMNFYYCTYYFGLGAEYSLGGSTSLTAGIEYNGGLTPVFKDDIRAKQNYLALSFGVIF